MHLNRFSATIEIALNIRIVLANISYIFSGVKRPEDKDFIC